MRIKRHLQKAKVKNIVGITLNKKVFFLTISFLLGPIVSFSQCAMCRASLESKDNAVQAEAVNDGIIFLMIMPYILVAFAAFAVYKLRYSKKQ
tara:strand:+ start:1356 stop:1634 length:279 start_codon:yes stop_codon:yes gene_type:complete